MEQNSTFKKKSSKQFWVEVFYSIIASYQETKSVVGTSGAIDYAQAVTNPGTNVQMIVGHCKPSQSDFIADVEICAKKALKENEYKFFVKYFKNADLEDFPNNERLKEIAKGIAETVGKRFVAYKIFPVKSYMTGKHVEINRGV